MPAEALFDLTVHDIPESLKQVILKMIPPKTRCTLTHEARQWAYRVPFLLEDE